MMPYKVKTSAGERFAYFLATIVFLLSLFIAFWNCVPK